MVRSQLVIKIMLDLQHIFVIVLGSSTIQTKKILIIYLKREEFFRMNKVNFMGRLATEPILRYTSNNKPVCNFSLAVERYSRNEKKVDFFKIVTWENLAEFSSKYLEKGRKISIWGSLQNREYIDNDGNKKYITELIAREIYFADSKKTNNNDELPYTA
jgi:single-strand DNA-binding protein